MPWCDFGVLVGHAPTPINAVQSADMQNDWKAHQDPLAGARFVRAGLIALLVLLGGCDQPAKTVASAREANSTHPNIILITLDTVRADHLGCYGYFRDTSPVFDAFAREAVLFENAYAPMATTLPSHTSLLTGYEPLEHGVLANIDDGGNAFGRKAGARSFAEVAKRAGYATAAFVSATPLKQIGGLNTGFDVYDEPDAATRDGAETTRHA